MATRVANAAVRERRRRSTPIELERMEILKALTAAEHSRRQFILNFAATRDTRLLVPGQKSDAVKAAEEWVANCFTQNGIGSVDSEYFKYTVDARLWSLHGVSIHYRLRQLTNSSVVGDDLDFPFAFMSGTSKDPSISSRNCDGEPNRPKSEAFLSERNTHTRSVDLGTATTLTAPPGANSTSGCASMKPRRRRSTKAAEAAEGSSEKRRSLSWTSVEELKMPKPGRDKFPLLVRFGRWSRRMSSVS